MSAHREVVSLLILSCKGWKETAQHRLVERVEQFSDSAYGEIWIIFDRRADKSEEAVGVASTDARIQVHYAPSADDWIVEQVRALSGQRSVTVVTTDRPLRDLAPPRPLVPAAPLPSVTTPQMAYAAPSTKPVSRSIEHEPFDVGIEYHSTAY